MCVNHLPGKVRAGRVHFTCWAARERLGDMNYTPRTASSG